MIGPGGIDSSSSSTRNPAETAPHPPLVEDSDEEIERLFGKDDEDNNDTPSASNLLRGHAVSYFIILINCLEQCKLSIPFAEHNFGPFEDIVFAIVLFEQQSKTLFKVLFSSL